MYRPALSVVLAVFAASAQAAPETYVIDAGRTSSEFSYRYLGIAEQTHRFERISGKVVFDSAARTGSADVAIDATSVSTGHALFDKTIQAAEFFDTARHPVITFRSTRMTLGGPQPSMTGELTIKGVTRPVTLAITQFQCAPDPVFLADACGARASVTIRRSDFNMGKLLSLVGDDVTLNLTIRAVKDAPALQLASRDPGK